MKGVSFVNRRYTKVVAFSWKMVCKRARSFHLGAEPPLRRAWYNRSYTMITKPIRALELHYPMIQFLIIRVMGNINPMN